MPAVASPRSGPGRARGTSALLIALVGVLLVAAWPAPPAAATAVSSADAVAAAAAAFGDTGTLAVVVAPQQTPLTGLTARAIEARTTRLAAASADNGQGDRVFPTASLVKLFLAEGVLARARAGQVTLTPDDLGTLQRMIARSSDPAASAVWGRFDGPGLVRDVAARYGLTRTAPPRVLGEWGEATTTARDLARFLALLPVVPHPDDAATLTGWMQGATPVAADGFDQRFGTFGALPGTPAVKQGWMCCVGGQRHLHSVAVRDGKVVVLLSEVPRSVGWAAGRAALTAAAAALAALPPGS
ncbi:LppW family protein [Geodermatophilus sp. SYSU D01105]